MIKKVKCVDAEGRKYLTEGKVYDVIEIQDDGDYIVIDDRNKEVKVFEDRFEDYNESESINIQTSPIVQHAINQCVPSNTSEVYINLSVSGNNMDKIIQELQKLLNGR